MKHTIEFNLPEDAQFLFLHLKGPEAHFVLMDLLNEMRTVYKYGEDQVAADHAEKWRDLVYALCADRGVKLYEDY